MGSKYTNLNLGDRFGMQENLKWDKLENLKSSRTKLKVSKILGLNCKFSQTYRTKL